MTTAAQRRWIHGSALTLSAVVTWLVFWPSLRNEFVSWDDLQMFPGNPDYRGLSWTQLRWMWTTFHYYEYMPLTWMTYGADYLVWGLDPFGYHLTNLILHTFTVLGVYGLGRRLLALGAAASETRDPVALALGAGVATLLFAIHPLRAEPVAWVSARGTILGGLFLVLTTLAYVNAVTLPDRTPAHRRWLLGSVGLFMLALLCRSTSVMLPLVLVALDAYPLRRLGGGPGRWLGRGVRFVWREKLPFVGLALAGVPAAFLARRMDSGASFGQVLAQLTDGVAVALYGLAFYLRKTLVPTALSPLYERPSAVNPLDWPFVASAAAVATVTGLLLLVRRRWPAGLTAWVCYVAILLPTSGLVSFGLQLAADRYSYVACLGFTFLAGAGWAIWWRRWEAGQVGAPEWAASLALAVAVVAFALLTHQQVQMWHDSKTLWTYTLTVEPRSAVAHAALGAVLEGEGHVDRAATHYQEAAARWPHDGERQADLGRVLLKQGKPPKAVERFREALRLGAGSPDVHLLLGIALTQLDRGEEAFEHHRKAAAMQPGSAAAHYYLARASSRLGRLDEAILHYTTALRIEPGFLEAREGLERARDRLEALQRGRGT